MRLPRDVSGTDLARALGRYGYVVTRQTGSHLRLTRGEGDDPQHVTIPAHRSVAWGRAMTRRHASKRGTITGRVVVLEDREPIDLEGLGRIGTLKSR